MIHYFRNDITTAINTAKTNNSFDKKVQETDDSQLNIQLPKKFTYPFHYEPHPLVVLAADEVRAYLQTRTDWQEELSHGKMFGVLLIQTQANQIGFVAAFSGNLAGSNHHEFFVPPVYDLLQPDDFFKIEEGNITAINRRIKSITSSQTYSELKENLRLAQNAAEVQLKDARCAMKEAKQKRDRERDEINSRLLSYEQLSANDKQLSTKDKQLSDSNRQLQFSDRQPLSNNKQLLISNRQSTDSSNTSDEIAQEQTSEKYKARLQELIRESQFQKAEFKRLERRLKEELSQKANEVQVVEQELANLKQERKTRSAALQMKLFQHFQMLNAKGEIKDLCQIFEETRHSIPPAGAGECALPKMLQYAYLHHLRPLAFGEFWWGESPKDEIRHHGQFYPSCKGKCEPILQHMLVGLEVDANPLSEGIDHDNPLKIIYEDKWIIAIEKPAGMLSTPGKEITDSVSERLQKRYPDATGPLLVHRLDMATSGILLAAKDKDTHAQLQALFEARKIKKIYTAILEGVPTQTEGCINLPLCLNPMDRPRQMVSYEHGKEAVTYYKVKATKENHALVTFDLLTGRTHQIRVHAAHPLGLNCPIVGDDLYGKHADRLYLHATEVEFTHPITGKKITLKSEVPFEL